MAEEGLSKEFLGKVLFPWELEREPDNLEVLKIAQTKIEEIKRYKETDKPVTIVLSSSYPGKPHGIPGFIKDSFYITKLWGNLPQIVEENVPQNEDEWGLFNRARPELYHQLQRQNPKTLHEIKEGNWEEYHICYPTNIKNVYYHWLGGEVPGEHGGWIDFFTINLTEKQIEELSKKSTT